LSVASRLTLNGSSFKGRTLIHVGREEWNGNQARKISLFVRDEQTGRFLFTAKALQALGINPVAASNVGIR
jgi:predicted amino acid racemase